MSVIVDLLSSAQNLWGEQTQNYCENYPEHVWSTRLLRPGALVLQQEITKYGDVQGLPALRDRIHRRECARWERSVDCSERTALVTSGATHALTVAALGLAERIDHVIAFVPAFAGFADVATFANKPFQGVAIDGPAPIESLLRSIAACPRPLVILNTPHNPTGLLFGDEQIAAVARAVSAMNGFLLLDAVYDELMFDSVSFIRAPLTWQGWDRVVTVNSFSKNYCLPGLRVGWLWCDQRLEPAFSAWIEKTLVCVSAHAQLVALQMLDQDLSALLAELDSRRRLLGTLLSSIPGASFELPGAGTSILARFAGYDTASICRELATSEGAVFLPGIAFPGGSQDTIRLSFGYRPESIHRFCKVLARALELKTSLLHGPQSASTSSGLEGGR